MSDPKMPMVVRVLPAEPDWKRLSFWVLVCALMLNGADMLELFPPLVDPVTHVVTMTMQAKLVKLGIMVLNGLGYTIMRGNLKAA